MLGNGLYLIRGLSPSYYVTKTPTAYRLYHKLDGFIVACKTQRQVRNAIRAYSSKGTKSIKGRE